MARTKGSANFSGSLEVLAGAPIDARSIVATKAELTASGNFPYKYIGMKVVVQSECKEYMLTGADTTNLNNWHEIGSGSSGGSIEGYLNENDGKFYEESTYETEIVGSQGYLYVTLDTNNIYRFDGSDFVNLTGIDVTIYQPGGSYFFANLPANNASHLGMVYDVKDDFTTTSDFIEGAGIDYPAGTNVVVINNGTSALPEYKYDVLAGNMSNYQKKVQFVSFPTASVDYLNMVYQYTGVSSTYVCGAFYKCQAQGTDPETYKWDRVPEDVLVGEIATAAEVEEAMGIIQPVNRANVRFIEVYSPNEQVVAEWQKEIDGVLKKKPVYQKRIDFSNITGGSNNYIAHNIANFDDWVYVAGRCGNKPIEHTNTGSGTYDNCRKVSVDVIEISSTNIMLWVGADFNGLSGFVNLRYLKTTDAWQPVS